MSETTKKRVFKLLSFGSLAIITFVLMAATIVEKIHGTELVVSKIYTSWWMIALWAIMAISSLIYLYRCGVHRHVRVLLLHLSFITILLGAITSHLTGRDGALHLREGASTTEYYLRSGGTAKLGFTLTLSNFELKYYEGTFAPMDYLSHIEILDSHGTTKGVVSMNNIVRYRGYRIYQSGYDDDGKGSTLLVTYDPYGIAITYLGYAFMLLTFILFFFDKNTMFRSLLRHSALRRLGIVIALLTLASGNSYASAAEQAPPTTLSKQAAERFCDVCVYYNDRITPLQTLANDFTAKLYGKSEYRGLTAEQVLTGWFFFYDDWKSEPMIKLKGGDVATALGISGKYASLMDFVDDSGYKLDALLRSEDSAIRKSAEVANEKFQLVRMLCLGTLFKIYPYTNLNGETIWYSMADELPQRMSSEEQLFVRKSMALVVDAALKHDDTTFAELMEAITQYQYQRAASMPSEGRLRAEKLYNNIGYNRPIAMLCLTLGIVCFVLFCNIRSKESKVLRGLRYALYAILGLLLAYLSLHIGLRYYISGHIPLANGYETMQFMSWCSVVLTLVIAKRFSMALPFGLLIAGFTLLVAMLGEASPRITQLMPVLQSPLLSIHVMVIMLSYTLLAFIMLNGVTAVVLRLARRDAEQEVEYLYVVSRIMLYPAVMLLAIGIFIGAIWANVSWGRYWGWDPKEVWALITMLIYAAMIHCASLSALRNPMTFHTLSIIAFLAVLITYFGVNFFLGGMHSYA
jgi:cytochrome c-type biogenesis protein CcsB